MTKIHYRVVRHDGGWAYKLGDVFSETFPSRDRAMAAAKRVAAEQHVPGETGYIEYQTEDGQMACRTRRWQRPAGGGCSRVTDGTRDAKKLCSFAGHGRCPRQRP